MEFSQIQSFVEAEGKGSFRKAAKSLLVSQSAVSNRIRLLEIELGVELFLSLIPILRCRRYAVFLLPFFEEKLIFNQNWFKLEKKVAFFHDQKKKQKTSVFSRPKTDPIRNLVFSLQKFSRFKRF